MAELDPRYVEARRVLLDALFALAPYGRAVILAGAQAVYLRTGASDLAVAPYTTDGDLALDPSLLASEPLLEAAMGQAGFTLMTLDHGHVEPGLWIAPAEIGGQAEYVPVDLIVPEGFAVGGGRRGARLGVHGNRAARRIAGLEALLIDHSPMTVGALDPGDERSVISEVAGPAGLLVAKAHKIHDRVFEGKQHRVDDKDAADVIRIMQATSPLEVGETLSRIAADPVAGQPTKAALDYLRDLFGSRQGVGIAMASRTLRLALDQDTIRVIAMNYIAGLSAGSQA